MRLSIALTALLAAALAGCAGTPPKQQAAVATCATPGPHRPGSQTPALGSLIPNVTPNGPSGCTASSTLDQQAPGLSAGTGIGNASGVPVIGSGRP